MATARHIEAPVLHRRRRILILEPEERPAGVANHAAQEEPQGSVSEGIFRHRGYDLHVGLIEVVLSLGGVDGWLLPQLMQLLHTLKIGLFNF